MVQFLMQKIMKASINFFLALYVGIPISTGLQFDEQQSPRQSANRRHNETTPRPRRYDKVP